MTDDIGKDLEALRPLPTRLAELTSDLRKLATCGRPTCLERRALSMLEEMGLELDSYQTAATRRIGLNRELEMELFGQVLPLRDDAGEHAISQALQVIRALKARVAQ